MMAVLTLRNLIPIMDILLEMTISIFYGWGFRVGEYGFSMGVLVYGFEVGGFLCGGVWFFWWFHLVGIGVGIFGEVRVEV